MTTFPNSKSSKKTNDELNIDIDTYKVRVCDEIGQGSTGRVLKCLIDRKEYAFKLYKDTVPLWVRSNELSILSQLHHDNIVRHIKQSYKLLRYRSDQSNHKDWFIMELLQPIDLYDIVEQQTLNHRLVATIFKKLIVATNYIHQKGFSHRDLKLENILFDQKYEVKICDFGFATPINAYKCYQNVGTTGYMAPELYEPSKSHCDLLKADVFALGVMLFMLLFRHPPFTTANLKDQCPFWRIIKLDKWSLYWNKIQKQATFQITESLQGLLEGMLDSNSETRYSIKEVLESEWVQEQRLLSKTDYYFQMKEICMKMK